MAQVEFQYNGIKSIIQCQENQKMLEICRIFASKSHLEENNLNFLYNGKSFKQFDKNLTFNQIANSIDKARKMMNILVISDDNVNNDNHDNNSELIRSKYIICPKCFEEIKIKNFDNYKLNLFDCKNNHKYNISLNVFEKTQMINLKNIKCNICNIKNKYNVYNNEFYKCYECNMNICPLCKLNHNKAHNIINYDKIHFICNKHNEIFTNYCKKCKKNICSMCEKEHYKHNKESIGDMILEKKELLIKLNELKQSIDIFHANINQIIEVLNNVKQYYDNYVKLEDYIINNYNEKERNYELLYNIEKLININYLIINDINQIDNENNIQNKFNYINNLYNKINNNEIKLTVKVEEDDIDKKIYFLDNTDGKIVVRLELNEKSQFGLNEIKEDHSHDFLKELNESNTELYINNKKYKYNKYFIPDDEGEYHILLKFHILMTDCSFMFYECNNITHIDLSSFNSQKVTNMYCMFFSCSNLKNIQLTSFNTQNVTNMAGLFGGCSNLKNIDLSSFNTQNVNNMSGMFGRCSNVTNFDLNSFNTQNVSNMSCMFFGCSNLDIINLSSFDTPNVTNMIEIFSDCPKLKEVKINQNLYKKIKNHIDDKIKIKYIE